MNRKLLAVAAVAAVGVVLNLGTRAAQSGAPQAPFKQLLTPASCLQPQWPAEARRYEIEGVTMVRFEIGADGAIVRPAVARSSGWRILDEAAVAGIARCRFQPDLDAARQHTVFPLQYVWKLSGPPMARPLLVQGSCAASATFAGFSEADPRPGGRDGILVRFLLSADGTAVRVVPEAAGQPAALVGAAVDYLQSCRFAHDSDARGERTDTGYGRVLLK
ncbi:energy transducer TonB [Duganella callida]|uniref:Energy transducer TonB n=1 Tax=Duganella callida TaxID=2561932 RepID=A0A4Y9RX67_9BURK|nr:energy transducer TonB [Duganella callida]TFW13664.1 energy transducer TonB [Duganella callida]